MKKNIIYIVCALGLLAVTSCKDFLTVDSPSKFDTQYIYSSEGEVFKAIGSIYQAMTNDAGYSNRLSMYYPCNNDVEMQSVNPATDGARRDIFSYEAKADNSEVTNPWNNAWAAVNYANEVVAGIEGSPLWSNPSDNVLHMYGEAKTLRAMWYLELVRNWGDLPFQMEPSGLKDFTVARPIVDRNEILSTLIDDLKSVVDKMKFASELGEGVERVSREFCQGMIARLALYRGGWSLYPDKDNPSAKGTMKQPEDYLTYYQIADQYLAQIISDAKHNVENSSYRQVFLNQCKGIVANNDDVIFEIPFMQSSNGEVGYYLGITMTSNSGSSTTIDSSIPTNHNFGTASGAVRMTPTYFYSFNVDDKRRDVNCALYTLDTDLKQYISNGPQNILVGKWCKAWMTTGLGSSSTKGTGINFPVLRFADVLLMYAETQNELNNGPTAAAKDALKRVRQRAFDSSLWESQVNAYITGLTTKADFFNALVNERAWEFGGEMVRKYDLVRWNLLGPKVRGMRNTMVQMGIDTRAGSGTYGNLGENIYWKRNDDGTIDIKGLYERIAAPAGYTTQVWLKNCTKDAAGTPADFVDRNWRGCLGNDVASTDPVVYILPIPATSVNASNGTWKNYYGK